MVEAEALDGGEQALLERFEEMREVRVLAHCEIPGLPLEKAGDPQVPDEITYTGGFDWALSPRLTFAVDVLGRTFRKTQKVAVVDTLFEANASTDPTQPNIVSAVLPRLVTTPGDVNTLLGSVGVKINPFGNFLLTLNGLFPLNSQGLTDGFTPLVGIDYSF